MEVLNRRSFLASSAGVMLAGRGAAAPSDTVAAGIIGTGNRGSYLLKAAIEQPNVKMIAVCDLKPDRLDKAASTAARDNPKTYTDYRKLLEQKDIDAVFIASPCDLHVEMATAALKAGKHVYCEKPAGINPESIKELIRVVRSSKTIYQIGQQMRSQARLAKTIEKVHQGAVGKVVMVKAQRHAGDDLSHDGPSADWFFNAKRSGDVIVEMAVHNLDVCNWAINSHPDRASGFGGALVWPNDPPGRTNMDGYTLSYDYANGVKMSFTQVFFHPNGMPGGGQYFYVYGTDGAIDLSSATLYRRGRGVKPEVLVEEEPRGEGRGGRDAHIAAFLESIRTGKKPPAGIVEAATGALTAIMGRDAIYSKKMVTWKEMGVEI